MPSSKLLEGRRIPSLYRRHQVEIASAHWEHTVSDTAGAIKVRRGTRMLGTHPSRRRTRAFYAMVCSGLPLALVHSQDGDWMPDDRITAEDRRKARKCLQCPVCSYARRKQRGLVFWFVKRVEGGLCPQCKAYEKVYGRKPHEPLAGQAE